jgi:hypothetical protein
MFPRRRGLSPHRNTKPHGTHSLESEQGFFGRPSPQTTCESYLHPRLSAVDALCVFQHQLVPHHYQHYQWQTLTLATLLSDTASTPNIRTCARRFGHITWQYCHTCYQHKMAGQRLLTHPPHWSPKPNFHEYLVANSMCATCRSQLAIRTCKAAGGACNWPLLHLMPPSCLRCQRPMPLPSKQHVSLCHETPTCSLSRLPHLCLGSSHPLTQPGHVPPDSETGSRKAWRAPQALDPLQHHEVPSLQRKPPKRHTLFH